MAIKVANNRSMASITALPSGVSGGAWTLISTQTASSSATLSFTSGLDSTYAVYCFKFINCSTTAGERTFDFNGSIDTGSNYNVAKTSSFFRAQHTESDSTELAYQTGNDLAQGTGFQNLVANLNSDGDSSCSGTLYLFEPSSTTFVKHFISQVHAIGNSVQSANNFCAGYFNTTSAVDAIQFKMSADNINAGVIKLYGIS
mgnify:CR=1 FL=1